MVLQGHVKAPTTTEADGLGWIQESVFLTISQVMLKSQGPHYRNHSDVYLSSHV